MNHKVTKAKIKMLDMGIIPAFTASELVEMMSSLDREQQRIVKRKFRKQWRKLLKSRPDLENLLIDKRELKPSDRSIRNRSIFLVRDILKQSS